MKVSRQQPGGEQYLALQALARATGQGFDQLATLYALEGFLRRLAESENRDAFVLKGGVLLSAFDARRPTRDADLLALDLANEREIIEGVIGRIAAVMLPDGLMLEPDTIASQVIRDDDEYSGIRVKLSYALATMSVRIGVDVNVGDPVYPEPEDIAIPGLLGHDISLRGYRLPTVIAEKAVTGMQRGIANTRWRDWADIWTVSRQHAFNAEELAASIASVAQHRVVTIFPIAELLADYPAVAQARWRAWRRRPDVTQDLPEEFSRVLTDVARFIDPVMEHSHVGLRWNPLAFAWERAAHGS